LVKIVMLLSHWEGMSSEGFGRYLRERHLPLVAALPGLRRLVGHCVIGEPPAYDAVAEDRFYDSQAMDAALGSPDGQAVIADAPNFLDMTRFQLPSTGVSDPSSEAPTLWTWVAMFGTLGASKA
jgi:uncharacterized protein (TIGR02118 family)